jgi:hypothetical protein
MQEESSHRLVGMKRCVVAVLSGELTLMLEKCLKVETTTIFRLCSGCHTVYYCSKACQQRDWKDGRHRDHCKLVRQNISKPWVLCRSLHRAVEKVIEPHRAIEPIE